MLVAHNENRFDIPFLLSKLPAEINQKVFKYQIDTMELAKITIKELRLDEPENYKLFNLYNIAQIKILLMITLLVQMCKQQ